MINRQAGKTVLVMSLSAVMTLGLAGCSGEDESQSYQSDSGEGVSAPKSDQQQAADVKQPMTEQVEQKAEAVEEAVVEKAEMVKETVEQKVEQAEETVTQVAEKAEEKAAEVMSSSPSGSSVYQTCVSCHGANGEGGVGPKLAGQSEADLVAKLKKYKAGEQVGPMTAMMAPMASGLSDEEIEAVAGYITTF